MADLGTIRYPHINHPNGSGVNNLRNGFVAQYEAIDAAIKVVQNNCPHTRDFMQGGEDGPKLFEEAMEAHKERIHMLLEIRDSFTADYNASFDM